MALEVKFRVQYQSQKFVFRLPFNFSVTKEQVGMMKLFPFGGKTTSSVLLELNSIFHCHAHKHTLSKSLLVVQFSSVQFSSVQFSLVQFSSVQFIHSFILNFHFKPLYPGYNSVYILLYNWPCKKKTTYKINKSIKSLQ